MTMKKANIAMVKEHLSSYITMVEKGEEIEVCKRNVPVARIVPVKYAVKNRTVLGCGKGSGHITGDLTEPLIPESDWSMHS